MNTKTLWAVVVIVILAVAGYWYATSKSSNEEMMENRTGTQENASSTDAMSGSTKPDTLLVGSENITGSWQSTTDAKYSRVFKADGTVIDSYDGKVQTRGTWKLYTAANSLTSIPLEANAVYLQVKDTTAPNETYDYKVQFSADANTLTLYYLQRGGALEFKRVQ